MEGRDIFANYEVSSWRTANIGVLLGLVWLKIDGTGLDGFWSIYQGKRFFNKGNLWPQRFFFDVPKHKPKPCKDAEWGEDCYWAVRWLLKTGIHTMPEAPCGRINAAEGSRAFDFFFSLGFPSLV